MTSGSRARSDAASRKYASARMSALPAANSTKYHSASCTPNVCVRPSRLEDIPDAADGMEERCVKVPVDFLAKPEDEHIDHVAARIEAVAPDLGQDHGLGHGAPGVAHQQLQQRELARPQVDGAPLTLAPARQPIASGEHEVEHDRVIPFPPRHVEPVVSVRGMIDRIPCLTKPAHHERADRGIVFDNEDTHSFRILETVVVLGCKFSLLVS